MSGPATTLQTTPSPPAAARRPANRRMQVGWRAPSTMDHREWIAAGQRFGEYGRISNWWIGDWLRYGTSRWGEKYVEAARITGLEPKTLRNIVYVASAFELSRRRDTLTWSHHAEVAGLDASQQDLWLDRAVAQRLSPADLRIEVRAAERGRKDESAVDAEQNGEHALVALCPNCGFDLSTPADSGKPAPPSS